MDELGIKSWVTTLLIHDGASHKDGSFSGRHAYIGWL